MLTLEASEVKSKLVYCDGSYKFPAICLEFSIVEDEALRDGTNEQVKDYGIRITKKNVEPIQEVTEIRNITTNYDEINRILNILYENNVTPITSKDVIRDIIDS